MKFDASIVIKEYETVYPVGEDSILLVESLKVKGNERVLEIGCGSGVVALHCAKAGCSVAAVDINPEAVRATRYNAGSNGLSVNVLESDLFRTVSGTFDLIIFNLPYLPVEDSGVEAKAWAGGSDGLGPLPRLLEEFPAYLNAGGRLVVVTSSLQDQVKLKELTSRFIKKTIGVRPLFFEQLSVLELKLPPV